MTDETREALFALRREGVLHFGECINCGVEEYRAFGGVEDVFVIEKVMRQPLEDVSEGVKMPQPVYVELGLKTEYIDIANVSHKGIIVIYYWDNSEHYLQLTGIYSMDRVQYEVECNTAAASVTTQSYYCMW